LSDAITSERVTTGGLSAAICDLRSSTVRIDPVAVRFAVETITRAPCSWLKTPDNPLVRLPSAEAEMEKGISARRVDGGAEEL